MSQGCITSGRPVSSQGVCKCPDGPVCVARCSANLRRSFWSGFRSIHFTWIETGHEINGSNPGKISDISLFTWIYLFERNIHKWQIEVHETKCNEKKKHSVNGKLTALSIVVSNCSGDNFFLFVSIDFADFHAKNGNVAFQNSTNRRQNWCTSHDLSSPRVWNNSNSRIVSFNHSWICG
jgi:hypothetical protein